MKNAGYISKRFGPICKKCRVPHKALTDHIKGSKARISFAEKFMQKFDEKFLGKGKKKR